jgi:hypothetical protein
LFEQPHHESHLLIDEGREVEPSPEQPLRARLLHLGELGIAGLDARRVA